MAKADLLRRTDQQPAATAGRFQTTSVTTVTSLTMAGPYYGDFQIAGGGRLIVGEGTDTGARIVANNGGLYGYDQYGAQTFALYTNSSGTHTPGDLFAGSTLSNYLQYDASAGTFGLYNTAGAGFIATANGDLQAGLATGAHMRWNATEEALQIRWGDEVRISLDADGNAIFTGEVNATGGTITGDMAVSGRLQVGEVDGPQVNIGVALDEGTNEYFSEIVATNAENVPWFHVRAGGPYPYGWLTIGAPGDYPHQLTYNGDVLKLDGDIYARTGYFYDVIQMQQSAQTAVRGMRALGDTTGGEIRQGTGTPGSNFTGLRMGYINDGDGVWQLAGYSNNVKQAYFGADGKVYAGAGVVKLDVDGISISGGAGNGNTITWYDSTTEILEVYSDNDGSGTESYIRTSALASQAVDQPSFLRLESKGPNSEQSLIDLYSAATGVAGVIVINDVGTDTDFRLETNTEENMIFSDASEDLLYLGGTTNGIKIAKAGGVTLIGTGKYERHIQIEAVTTGAVANQPTDVDFFTAGGLQYPTTGAKYAFCQWEVPDDWDGTDVYFEVDWFPDSGATSGTDAVRWTVEYRAIAEGETINNGTSVTVDNGAGGDTTDYAQYTTKHTRFTLVYNNANQPLTKQDHVYFKVSRDTGVANDFGGSVTVTAYEIIYTSAGFPTSN